MYPSPAPPQMHHRDLFLTTCLTMIFLVSKQHEERTLFITSVVGMGGEQLGEVSGFQPEGRASCPPLRQGTPKIWLPPRTGCFPNARREYTESSLLQSSERLAPMNDGTIQTSSNIENGTKDLPLIPHEELSA